MLGPGGGRIGGKLTDSALETTGDSCIFLTGMLLAAVAGCWLGLGTSGVTGGNTFCSPTLCDEGGGAGL